MAKKKSKNKAKKFIKSVKKIFSIIIFIILIITVIIANKDLIISEITNLFNPSIVDKTPEFNSLGQDENGFYYYNSNYEVGSYYYDAYNKTGNDLKNTLNTIVNTNLNRVSYENAKHVLSYTDRVTVNGETYVLGIYDNEKIATNWVSSGDGRWQREHVWPNSKLGVARISESGKNQASDLHNLRAISGKGINQTRSNRFFTNPLDNQKNAHTVGTESFYPSDEHKGDVARILFYMVVAYDFLTLTDDTTKLTNDPETNYTLKGAFQGELSILLKWHKEDPVSEFELNRNEFIYSGIALDDNNKEVLPQGNRNPFIDKPEYAHLIFEGKTVKDLTKEEISIKFTKKIVIIELIFRNQLALIFKENLTI